MLSFVNIIIARHCQLVSRYLFSNFSCYVLFFPDIIRMCMCVCYFLSFSLSLAFHSFRFCLKTFSYFHFMFWHFRKKNFLRYYYMNISYDYTMDVIFKSNGKWQSKRYTLLTAADKILWWIKIPYVILANKRQTMSVRASYKCERRLMQTLGYVTNKLETTLKIPRMFEYH